MAYNKYRQCLLKITIAISCICTSTIYSFAQPKIEKGRLSFLKTTYSSVGVGQCVPEPSTYSVIDSTRIYRFELPSECNFVGFNKLSSAQAREQYGKGQYEENAYQVFYQCPISDGQQFPGIVETGLMFTSAKNRQLRFVSAENFAQYIAAIRVDEAEEGSEVFYECGEVLGEKKPIVNHNVKAYVGGSLQAIRGVNYRVGPGNWHSAKGAFRKGQIVKPTGKAGNWYRFQKNGKTVYSYKRHFQLVSSKPTPVKEQSVNFSGFSCDVLSYGGNSAKQMRIRILSDLYKVYGCSEPKGAQMREGFGLGFHAPTSPNGPWSGFAATSTVLYYDRQNAKKAANLARKLSNEYGRRFQSQRGGGQGLKSSWYKRALLVHVRDDK